MRWSANQDYFGAVHLPACARKHIKSAYAISCTLLMQDGFAMRSMREAISEGEEAGGRVRMIDAQRRSLIDEPRIGLATLRASSENAFAVEA